MQLPNREELLIEEVYAPGESNDHIAQAVHSILKYIDPSDLCGLRKIVLAQESILSKRERGIAPRRSRKTLRKHGKCGEYYAMSSNSPAWIRLVVDNIIPLQSRLFRLRCLMEIQLAMVLFHEIGHHVHTLKPKYCDSELFANEYRDIKMKALIHNKYWYLILLIIPSQIFSTITRRFSNMKISTGS